EARLVGELRVDDAPEARVAQAHRRLGDRTVGGAERVALNRRQHVRARAGKKTRGGPAGGARRRDGRRRRRLLRGERKRPGGKKRYAGGGKDAGHNERLFLSDRM